MNNDTNDRQAPRIIRGAGYHTSMDIAPGEQQPTSQNNPAPSTAGNMATGYGTQIDVEPSAPDPTPDASQDQ